jgi:hypothetical protein
MHRLLQITVKPSATDEFCAKIRDDENIVGLSVMRGASVKPPGDVVTVYVLNRGADDVLQAIEEVTGGENYSVASSQVSSLIDPKYDNEITSDVDEAIWEEIATGLRHQGRVSPNFLALMSLGGAVAAIGLTLDGTAQMMTFTAAAIIAPGFEPLAKIPLGTMLRSWITVKRGFYSSAVGYAVLLLTAAATMFLLLQTNTVTISEMTGNEAVQSLTEPGLRDFLVSTFSAAAGIVMLAAYRKSVIAGPLIGLVMIQAVALVGASLVAGQYDLCLAALRRFGYDVLFTIVFGLLIFYLKQILTHKRKPLV